MSSAHVEVVERAPGRPEIQCAAALPRDYYCRLPVSHAGDHERGTRKAEPATDPDPAAQPEEDNR